jgi:hypothetical protein
MTSLSRKRHLRYFSQLWWLEHSLNSFNKSSIYNTNTFSVHKVPINNVKSIAICWKSLTCFKCGNTFKQVPGCQKILFPRDTFHSSQLLGQEHTGYWVCLRKQNLFWQQRNYSMLVAELFISVSRTSTKAKYAVVAFMESLFLNSLWPHSTFVTGLIFKCPLCGYLLGAPNHRTWLG